MAPDWSSEGPRTNQEAWIVSGYKKKNLPRDPARITTPGEFFFNYFLESPAKFGAPPRSCHTARAHWLSFYIVLAKLQFHFYIYRLTLYDIIQVSVELSNVH